MQLSYSQSGIRLYMNKRDAATLRERVKGPYHAQLVKEDGIVKLFIVSSSTQTGPALSPYRVRRPGGSFSSYRLSFGKAVFKHLDTSMLAQLDKEEPWRIYLIDGRVVSHERVSHIFRMTQAGWVMIIEWPGQDQPSLPLGDEAPRPQDREDFPLAELHERECVAKAALKAYNDAIGSLPHGYETVLLSGGFIALEHVTTTVVRKRVAP